MRTHKWIFGIILSSLFLISPSVLATNYYVDPDGNDLNAGTSWANAFATIQKGINTSSNGDIVEVNEGTYHESINFNGKAITLRSTDPNNWETVAATIIDANHTDHTVAFYNNEGADSILEGLTIQGGDGYMDCGIYCHGEPIIRRCIIQNNYYKGIYCLGSALITDNIIRNNYAFGVYPYAYSSPIITNNLIYDNGYWGIATSIAGTVTIRNNTIVNNGYGGISNGSSTLNISNCILWGNGDDLSGCAATYSCIEDGDSGTGNINSVPLFVDADANDFHLQSNSPCIDIGDPNGNYTSQTDIDNESRLIDGDDDETAKSDIGCDEFNPLTWSNPDVIYVDQNATGSNNGSCWLDAYTTIAAAVNAASAGDEIWVAEGTYTLTSQITVSNAISIYGGFNGTEITRSQRDFRANLTIINGNDTVRCFSVTNNATIDGFVIS
ncbi:MAG: right-handed parallel beta-helix repeat-containing protein, partial [Phycisphaerae bacterium]|nr:right-handed parallel beta-helix repeat-containing protein [Phycisphaerae bacterium]